MESFFEWGSQDLDEAVELGCGWESDRLDRMTRLLRQGQEGVEYVLVNDMPDCTAGSRMLVSTRSLLSCFVNQREVRNRFLVRGRDCEWDVHWWD